MTSPATFPDETAADSAPPAPVAGVPAEATPGERRVAATPDTVKRLRRSGFEVVVEAGAGAGAFVSDAAFEAVGARVVGRAEALAADLVLTVRGLGPADRVRPGAVVVGLLRPLDAPDALAGQAAAGATLVAMELVPRTTLAQSMDALSAMSSLAGYRAAVLAAVHLPQLFPLMTTAAGTVRPARVLVLGAGVAGLQALATARRLGAATFAYDVRAAAREQVESVGAQFVDLGLESAEGEGGYARALTDDEAAAQTRALEAHVATAQVLITTALVPGRPAPRLVTAAGVEAMIPGSVVVDLAASGGGNVEGTQPGETVTTAGGVTILGPLDLAAEMPVHASAMFARTVAALAATFVRDGRLRVDLTDDIHAGAVVAHEGAVVHPRVRALLSLD